MAKKKAAVADDGGAFMALAKPEIPVDSVAMRKAAEILGIEVPQGDHADQELLGALRAKMQKLLKKIPTSDYLRCEQCNELSTDATDFCPFCGDGGMADDDEAAEEEEENVAEVVGDDEEDEEAAEEDGEDEEEDEDDEEKVPAPAKSVGIATVPTSPPARDVSGDMVELEKELAQRIAQIRDLNTQTITTTWETGILLKEISDRSLYRARGYESFQKFAANELPLSRQTAYQLVALVEQYDRKTFEEIGFRKLKSISTMTGTDRKALLADARGGASARQIEDKVKKKKARQRPALVAPPGSSKKAAAAPPPDGKVTLLTKLDAKPFEVKFRSQKSGAVLDSAGKVTMLNADAYGDVEVAEGVHMRIGFRIKGRDLIGLTVQFVRAAEAAE